MSDQYDRNSPFKPFADVERAQGFWILTLIGGWNRWVKRRVEKMEFTSDSSITRRASVDFRIPQEFASSVQASRASLGAQGDEWNGLYVPLTLLNKSAILDVNLRNERGEALPLVTRRRNGRLAASALAALAQMVIFAKLPAMGSKDDASKPNDFRQIRLPDEIERLLLQVAYRPFSSARGGDGVDGFGAYDYLKAAAETASEAHGTTTSGPGEWSWAREQDQSGNEIWRITTYGPTVVAWLEDDRAADPLRRRWQHLLEDFARLWMVTVPLHGDMKQRRVFKMSYAEVLPTGSRLPGLRQRVQRIDEVGLQRLGLGIGAIQDRLEGLAADERSRGGEWRSPAASPVSQRRRIRVLPSAEWLGDFVAWRGRDVQLAAPGVGRGGSYHLEVEAPPGCQIRRMAVRASRPDRTTEEHALRFARSLEHGHVYLGPRQYKERGTADVVLKLRGTGSPSLRALTMLMWSVAVVIGATVITTAFSTGGAIRELPPLLVLAPALPLGIAVGRAREHPLTTSMLFGVRALSWLGAGMSLAAACLVAACGNGVLICLILCMLFLASAAIALVLTVSWLLAYRSQPDGSAP